MFLSLTLPGENGEEIVNCEGIVVRSEPAGEEFTTGISFTSFRPEEAEKLIDLLGNENFGKGGGRKAKR